MRCVKTDIPCAVCGRAAPNGGSARITCRKSAAAYVLPDAVNVIVCARDIANLIPVVCARVTALPTVPGTPGYPENHLLLLVLSGASCLPGTVGKRGQELTRRTQYKQELRRFCHVLSLEGTVYFRLLLNVPGVLLLIPLQVARNMGFPTLRQ